WRRRCASCSRQPRRTCLPFTPSRSSTGPSCGQRIRSSGSTRRSAARADVVGIFPNDAAVIRLVGALLSEQNDEWLVQRPCLSVESMALILAEPTDPEQAQTGQEVPSLTAA